MAGTIVAQSYLGDPRARFINVDYSGKSINSYDIMITVNTDVLVLGAGAAGIRAAVSACKKGAQVTIVSKGQVAESGSTFSNISKGWGIQALVEEERSDDNIEDFYDEIIDVGLGQCDAKLVRILVEESGSRVEDLISYGIRFRKNSDGNFLRVKGCFSDYKRAFVADNLQNIQNTFISLVRNTPVKILKGIILDLIITEGICFGALCMSSSGDIIKIYSRATILATGGAAGVYKDHLVSDEDVGDGYALAYRAGAELKNMEFIQFMLGLKHNGTRSFLAISDLQKLGKMQIQDGSDPLETHIPDAQCRSKAVEERLGHYPFSCRDSSYLVDLAVARARDDGDRIYWEQYREEDETRPQVIHFAHAFNGGVRINDEAESSVPGLYAAGEVAAGPHGADRIGGCMMASTQVFGEIAGRFGAKRAKKLEKYMLPDIEYERAFGGRHSLGKDNHSQVLLDIKKDIKGAMSKYAAVLKWEQGLKKCKKILCDSESRLEEIRSKDSLNPMKLIKVRNMILASMLIVDSALLRKESRGAHFREDFPKGG